MKYYVYILTSKPYGTLYIGVSNNLIKRVYAHKKKFVQGFTKKYNVNKLVYFEEYDDIREAIAREKCIKRWKRSWKIKLINKNNSKWNDLYEDIIK